MKLLLCLFICGIASAWAQPAQPKRKDPMFNPGMFQGDMVRNLDRNGLPYDSQRWPNGVIPYVIDDPSLSPLVLDAMKHISSKTCIRFVKRTNEQFFLKIYRGDGCWAYWGYYRNENLLSLGEGCYQLGVIVHELTHTIGFDHEHNRSDRDDYLVIHWENIDEENHDAFQKLKPNEERLFTSFDFDSIMLYGSKNAARTYDLDAMTAIDGRFLKTPEDKKYLSNGDIKRIKMLYQCK